MSGLFSVFIGVCVLCLFLLAGKVLRVKVKLFQNIYLPASITGGFPGLIFGPFVPDLLPEFMTGTWQQIPGVLINIVFATLFLGVAISGIIYNFNSYSSYRVDCGAGCTNRPGKVPCFIYAEKSRQIVIVNI